jgi:hypothetical protein
MKDRSKPKFKSKRKGMAVATGEVKSEGDRPNAHEKKKREKGKTT